MLQQIIMQDKRVISFPEPWLMLPLVHAYKDPQIHAGFNPTYAQINLCEHLQRFVNGTDFFKNEIRNLALRTYGLSDPAPSDFILDKTPRYYHIIPELIELFPRSKIILLARNPVSVFSSILSYNFHGNVNTFLNSPDRLHDLITAPRAISAAKAHRNCHFVQYECFIENPDTESLKISKFLTLDPLTPAYSTSSSFSDSRGIDHKSVSQHERPVANYLETWRTAIDTETKKSSLLNYLTSLGQPLLHSLGYDFQQLVHSVENHHLPR